MDIRDKNNYIFNIRLAKLTGLYKMLDPGTVKYRGQNVYHITIACVMLYICLISMILMASCLYYCTVDIPMSIEYFWKSKFTLYVIYKMWFIVHHSNDIWNCLSITRYDFTSFSNRNRHILDRWRDRLAWLTILYVIIYHTTTLTYFVITLIYSESKSPVKNHDGSIGYYRQNIMNLYLLVSDETYNAHYYTFYFIEVIFLTSFTLFFCVFDIFLVSLCFGMQCQMQMICSAFESVGHKSLRNHHSPIVVDSTDENKKKTFNVHDLIYDELKTIIMDHQLVLKKYENFLTLYRRVMLLHIFVSSFLVILLWLTFIMKDSIISALYSSNWTEMDMKCKKLILLTMKLNNADRLKLKFTRTKIVNLEMFFKTMGDCYTIISVLVNYIRKKDE